MVAASVRMSTATINNTDNTIQPQLTITIHITSNTTLNMHINTRYGSHGTSSSLLLPGPRLRRRLRVANTALWPPRMSRLLDLAAAVSSRRSCLDEDAFSVGIQLGP